MPRIRTVKPDFWKSRSVKKLTDREKLVWLGLWNYADDYGRIMDEPVMLVGELWALGLNAKQMEDTLAGLHTKGRIVRYVVEGDGFIQVTGWEHQKISHPTDSGIPPVPLPNNSGMAPDSFLLEGRGREGIGGGGAKVEPESKCSKHLNDPNPPKCGACGDARRAHDAWVRAEKNKPTASGIVTPPTCKHEYPLSLPCPHCESEAAA